jgi:hypothetical protein
MEDNSFYLKRTKYCQDFRRIFPNSDESIIRNTLKAEAESYTEPRDMETTKKIPGID